MQAEKSHSASFRNIILQIMNDSMIVSLETRTADFFFCHRIFRRIIEASTFEILTEVKEKFLLTK